MEALKAAHAKASLLSRNTHDLHTLQKELWLLKGQLQQSQEAAQESQQQLQESKQQLQECKQELQECREELQESKDERALVRHELECSVASEKALQRECPCNLSALAKYARLCHISRLCILGAFLHGTRAHEIHTQYTRNE